MLTASIVIYNEDLSVLQNTVNCFLKTPFKKKLFIIDNSPVNTLENYFNDESIEYLFVGKNIGFGRGHNLILDKIDSDFHLILNPDLTFSAQVIPTLIKKLKTDSNLAMIAPSVLYADGSLQHTSRKYPSPLELIYRRLHLGKGYVQNREYRNLELTKPFYPDFIYGCFMLFNTNDFKLIKGFDQRYFLYMEDADICRKIDAINKQKLYFPYEEITHEHRKASSKKIKFLFYHLNSAFKYFLKWGI